jgi:hypothetical protein
MEMNKKSAETIFKKIKDTLTAARKANKDLPLGSYKRKSQEVRIDLWTENIWERNKKTAEVYVIKMNGVKAAEVKTRYDVEDVFKELRKLLDGQKKTKGWGGLNYAVESINLDASSWCGYHVDTISKVTLADAPCPEYKSLMNYINKYGKAKYDMSPNVRNYEFFSAAMGGKRGRLWDEYGERAFLDNKPKKCARLLEELRKARGSKDLMLCLRDEEDYIDPEEQRYSAYEEIECEGERRKYLRIVIKTPTGKVKYDEKLY